MRTEFSRRQRAILAVASRPTVENAAVKSERKSVIKMLRVAVSFGLLCFVGILGQKFDQNNDWTDAKSIYEFRAKDIHGQEVSLDKYRGHVAIIINVASQCGLTETNYKQLQSLYEKYGESKGLRVLAFPSNEFAGQEPGTSQEILDFVKKYNVSFDMFEKIKVNGDDAHPLYKWLKSQKEGAGTITDAIKWNFTKFIIDKNGQVVDRFAPTTEPFEMEDALKKYF